MPSSTPCRAAFQRPTKTIIVYRNGDAFFPGRKVVVNQRQLVTFDSFLTFLTSGIEAPFGAVRNIYTSRDGHRVIGLDELQHGEGYVAAGSQRFKKLDYWQITTSKPDKKKNEQIQPVIHSRMIVPARWMRNNESCTINVFTNGAVFAPPARILIPKYTLTSWEKVLAIVTQKVDLRTGAVYRLYTLDGSPLHGPADLENNQYYVAVGAGQFRALSYDQWLLSRPIIRENHIVHGTSREHLPSIQKTRHAKVVFAHTGFGEDVEHTARGQMKNHKDSAKPERAKQQRHVSTNPLLFSTGECSVFNAKNKREEMTGAVEVQDDCQLTVDLPIDQVEATEVEEEFGLRPSNTCGEMERPQGSSQERGLPAGHRRAVPYHRKCFQAAMFLQGGRSQRESLSLMEHCSHPGYRRLKTEMGLSSPAFSRVGSSKRKHRRQRRPPRFSFTAPLNPMHP